MMIEVPRHMVGIVLSLLLGMVIIAGAMGYYLARQKQTSVPPASLSEAQAPTYAANPGPWGELQCQRSIIEVPEAYLGLRNWETEPVRWFFRGSSSASVNQFLARLPLSADENKDLTAAEHRQITAEGVFVQPSLKTILDLNPKTRAALYAELAKDEENVMQSQPFHWLQSEADHLFDSAALSPSAIAVFHKLAYGRGKYLLFSDWKALLSALPDSEARNAMAQALMGRFVLFASIRLTPQTDLKALLDYWGAGGNTKAIRPIIEAAARVPQGMSLSLANFLPPHIRAQINTFPFTAPDEQLNCHWTSFNFFNPNPLPPAGVKFWRGKLQSDYAEVKDAPRYGDILLLLKPDNKLIHSCVYLADNIVYTKNGGSPFAPWQLSTIPDLLTFYSWDLPEQTGLKTVWYRKKS